MAMVTTSDKRTTSRKKTNQGAGRGTKKKGIKPYRGQGGRKRSKRLGVIWLSDYRGYDL